MIVATRRISLKPPRIGMTDSSSSNTSDRTGPADPQSQSPLFSKLPPEIRIEVYQHLAAEAQHVEKEWDLAGRRGLLRRRAHHSRDDTTLVLGEAELPLLLVCRRAYLEALPHTRPRALVFTELDTLSAYLGWPALMPSRRRVRSLECSWRAAGLGGLLPAWKAQLWDGCCERLAALPDLRRLRVCVFVSDDHSVEVMENIRSLAHQGWPKRVRVDVDVIGEAEEKNACRFMTGRSMVTHLFGREGGCLEDSGKREVAVVT